MRAFEGRGQARGPDETGLLLDLMGFAPVVGDGIDFARGLVDGARYVGGDESAGFDALINLGSAIPVVGSPLLRGTKYFDEAADILRGVSRADEFAGTLRFWKPMERLGHRVYQRSDLIDPRRSDALGRSNLDLMRAGKAPIGPDGARIELHHLLQTMDGPIAEVTATLHRSNARILNINPPSIPSAIDRAFETWRATYWKLRACDFGGC